MCDLLLQRGGGQKTSEEKIKDGKNENKQETELSRGIRNTRKKKK